MFCIKFLKYQVLTEIKKHYYSMTTGTFGTHRAYGAHGTLGTNETETKL